MQLSFDEIIDNNQFENLVFQYFNDFKGNNYDSPQIRDIRTEQPGKGTDGRVDIIVTFVINDTIYTYEKKWLIQCKFHKSTLNPSMVAEDNIPTLIHSYGADGYLLLCKGDVSQKLVDTFKRLNDNCKWKYHYLIWNGETFRGKLLERDHLLKTFFPKYYRWSRSNNLLL